MPVQMFTQNEDVSTHELRKFWQLFAILFIAFAIPLTLVALKLFLDFRSKADDDPKPIEVIVSNITDTSVSISFVTEGDPVKASIKYGPPGGPENESFFDLRAEDGTESFNLHYHQLTNLIPGQAYEYTITIGATEYPNPNTIFANTFNTLPTSVDVPTPKPINGTIGGSVFDDGVIYAHLTDGIANSMVVSSLIPETSGAYTLDLGNARKIDGTDFTEATDIIVFASIAGQGRGFESSNIDEQMMPEITLDSSQDLYDPINLEYADSELITGTPTSTPTEEAPTTVPTSTPTEFQTPIATELPTQLPTPTPTRVIVPLRIINISQNESIYPGAIIMGEGEPNSTVTFTLDQTEIGTTYTTSTGSWQFELPENTITGNSVLLIENETNTYTLNIHVRDLEDLPDTAIGDYTTHIASSIIIICGIYLINWVKRNKQWGTSN